MKKVLLLGASGNIGTQVVDILEKDPLSFSLVGISVGKRIEKIEGILKRFPSVSFLCLERREDVPSFKERMAYLILFVNQTRIWLLTLSLVLWAYCLLSKR